MIKIILTGYTDSKDLMDAINQGRVYKLYFYRENLADDFVANHVDARTHEGLGVVEQSCFASFFKDGEVPTELVELGQ